MSCQKRLIAEDCMQNWHYRDVCTISRSACKRYVYQRNMAESRIHESTDATERDRPQAGYGTSPNSGYTGVFEIMTNKHSLSTAVPQMRIEVIQLRVYLVDTSPYSRFYRRGGAEGMGP